MYQDACAASRMLYAGLVSGGETLLLPEAQRFFTEHSPRAWLPSAAASLGYGDDVIDSLAAWRPRGGAAYVRTVRRRMQKVQADVASKLRVSGNLDDWLDEESEGAKLSLILQKAGVAKATIEQQLTLLLTECLPSRVHVGGDLPLESGSGLEASSSDEASEATVGGSPDGLVNASVAVADASAEKDSEDEAEPAEGDYVVSISNKKGFRRLHLVGACHRRPGVHYAIWVLLGREMPDSSVYDESCKDCWRGKAAGGRAESSKSSSTDSGAEASEPAT